MAVVESSGNSAAAPAAHQKSAHPRQGLVLGLACAAQAMVGLDIAIVNVALPSIQHDLGVSQSSVQWVVVAYGLLLGGFLLAGGRMTDLLGRRRVLLAGLGLFTTASLLAGLAQDGGVLIAARGLQGLGGALIAPAALSLLAVAFREGRERNRALGIFGAVAGAAGTVGVVASGLIAAGPGWRWAFFINLPVGLVLIALAITGLAADERGARSGRLDVAGASTVTGGLLAFVYALHHASTGGWTSPATLAWFGVAGALIAVFVRVEKRSPAPLVPGKVLRNRTLVAANVTALLAFGTFFSFIFLGSLLMQHELGYSPTQTGLAWLATTTTEFAISVVAGRLATTVSVRRLLATGLTLMAAAMVWLTRVPGDGDYLTDLLPAFLLAGLGFGLCGPSLQIGALSGVTESESGLASGLIETMREIGGAAGVAAVSTVLVAGTGLGGFHTAFAAIGILAGLGAITAVAGFRRGAGPRNHETGTPGGQPPPGKSPIGSETRR
ncbi:EmrB/QacA subfamily drug resistance transporter [Prauserella shujinwangii]|uniref:EmrB/QacA subfamily drug resistance transporter n=1 Tax=Prauserella shujinwangii TaxID=1453103 RepID=A0A2T0M0G2_9PSEU|nr:MFS transporter [Prauserella shujinwangii]PRX50085.1 EmrB/QacA subfamily drug resistance transporter [Prauserella shujinwangii]